MLRFPIRMQEDRHTGVMPKFPCPCNEQAVTTVDSETDLR